MTSRRALLGGAAALVAAQVAGCSGREPAAERSSVSLASTPSPSAIGTATAPTSPPLRFVVGSDGHLGDPKAPGDPYPEFVDAVNRLHAADPLDFVVVNGDIAQGGIKPQRAAKRSLDRLAVPYFAVPGNHDELTLAQWRDVWGADPDQVRRFGDRSIVLANTSNAAGEYRCADEPWLAQALTAEAGQRDVLVFMHITPKDWTKYGVDCPAVRKTLSASVNLRAVFNGHDHDQDGQLTSAGVQYFFAAHLGGHWGTDYTGFRLGSLDGAILTTRMVQLDGTLRPETRISW